MPPVPSPRHPWKALSAIVVMFALVHGARAHVFPHDPEVTRIDLHPARLAADARDCPDADVHFGPAFPFDDDGASDDGDDDRDVD